MSRHVLSPHADLARSRRLAIVAGWDGPLQTFFCQVQDLSYDENDARHDVLWRGCAWQEVLNVDEIIEALAPWAATPLCLRDALLADQAADRRGAKPPVLAAIESLLAR